MNDLFSSWRTAATLSSGSSHVSQIAVSEAIEANSQKETSPTYEQVMELINGSLSSLKVYVLESEITQSQNTVKSIVSQATF